MNLKLCTYYTVHNIFSEHFVNLGVSETLIVRLRGFRCGHAGAFVNLDKYLPWFLDKIYTIFRQ